MVERGVYSSQAQAGVYILPKSRQADYLLLNCNGRGAVSRKFHLQLPTVLQPGNPLSHSWSAVVLLLRHCCQALLPAGVPDDPVHHHQGVPRKVVGGASLQSNQR